MIEILKESENTKVCIISEINVEKKIKTYLKNCNTFLDQIDTASESPKNNFV